MASHGADAHADHRLTAKAAGYMELQGAQKDGDCHKVKVAGGVSEELGCCDKFEPEAQDVRRFRCGDCEYLKRGANK